MKKILLVIMAAVSLIFISDSLYADLLLDQNGQVKIGLSSIIGTNVVNQLSVDSTANLALIGDGLMNSGSKIAFGLNGNVSIGDMDYWGCLTLVGDKGLYYKSSGNSVFSINSVAGRPAPTTRAIFSCSVYAESFNTTSDIRLKKNVRAIGDRWESLSDLCGISYNLINFEDTLKSGQVSKGLKEVVNQGGHTYFGFAAQEVQEIFPELVSEDENGFLSINYNGFIPLLVDAYKNLEARNKELEAKLDVILNPVRKASDVYESETECISLGQNRPNPFTKSTLIDVELPTDALDAMICVYDMQGAQVMQLPVKDRGKTYVSIEGRSLYAGMYLYSLIVDGQEIATKRMILTN